LTQGLRKEDNFADIMFLSGTPIATAQFRYDSSGYLRDRYWNPLTLRYCCFKRDDLQSRNYDRLVRLSSRQDYAGSTYHVQSCGEVVATGSPSGYDSTDKTSGGFVLVRNTQSGAGTVRSSGSGTLKCFRGDSGGPWFANTIAFGIHSQCNWWDGAETIAMWSKYSSVDLFTT
jgi:hypothetical protein